MKKDVRSDKVVRAITIGIAAVIGVTSMPVNVFASDIDNSEVAKSGDSKTEDQNKAEEANNAAQDANASVGNLIENNNSEEAAPVEAVSNAVDSLINSGLEQPASKEEQGSIASKTEDLKENVNNAADSTDEAAKKISEAKGSVDDAAAADKKADEASSTYIEKSGEALSKAEEINNKVDEITAAIIEANDSLDKAETIDEVNKIVEEINNQTETASKEYDEAKKEYDEKKKAYEDALKEMEAADAEAKAKIEEAKAAYEDAEEKLGEASKELSEAIETAKYIEQKASEAVKAAEDKRDAAQKKVDEYTDKVEVQNSWLVGLKPQIDDAQAKVDETTRYLNGAKKKLGELQTALAEETSKPNNEAINTAQGKIDANTNLINETTNSITALNTALDGYKTQLEEEKKKGPDQNTVDAAAKNLADLKKEMEKREAHKDNNANQLNRYNEAKKAYEEALAAYNQLVNSSTADQQLIAELEEKINNCENEIAGKEAALITQKSNLASAENELEEAKKLPGGDPAEITRLEEQIAIYENKVEVQSSKLIPRQAELDRVNDLYDLHKGYYDLAKERLEGYEAAYKEAEENANAYGSLLDEAANAENAVLEAKLKVQALETRLDNIELTNNDFMNNNAARKEAVSLLKEKLDAANKQLEEAEQKKNEVEKELEKIAEKAENKYKEIEEAARRRQASSSDSNQPVDPSSPAASVIDERYVSGNNFGSPASDAGVAGARVNNFGQGLDVIDEIIAEKKANTVNKPGVNEDEELKTNDVVTFEDEEVPLASVGMDEAKKNMNWWWLLIVALFGATGFEMYKKNAAKKALAETKKKSDK